MKHLLHIYCVLTFPFVQVHAELPPLVDLPNLYGRFKRNCCAWRSIGMNRSSVPCAPFCFHFQPGTHHDPAAFDD